MTAPNATLLMGALSGALMSLTCLAQVSKTLDDIHINCNRIFFNDLKIQILLHNLG